MRVLIAGVVAGVIVGLAEAALALLSDQAPAVEGAAAWFSMIGRCGTAGFIVGAVGWLLSFGLQAIGGDSLRKPRARSLAILCVLGVVAALLILNGKYKRDGGAFYALAFGAICAWGTASAMTLLYPPPKKRGAALKLGGVPVVWPLALLAIAAGIGLLCIDPRGLRGAYPSLDISLLGMAGALVAVGWRYLPFSWGVKLCALVVALLIMAFARGGHESAAETSSLLATSPRRALVDHGLRALHLWPERVLDVEVTAIDPSELFTPPLSATDARAEWIKQSQASPIKSVVWVTMDAVRSDATGMRGGTQTPHLDALAAKGFSFPNAWSQAPGTAFSVESFTTSRYPSRSAVALAWANGGTEEIKFPPFAQQMTEAGLRTGFITGLNEPTLKKYTFERLMRGFEDVVTSPDDSDALRTADQASAWIESVPDEKPFFAWVHFFDPHYPYVARGDTPNDASPRERWASEIRYSDKALQRVLETLKQSGRDQETVVVVHSDHAEAFGEHGRFYHATSYFDAQLHIPLVIYVPGLKPAVVMSPVSNVDIVPTLSDLLQKTPPTWYQGHSLLPTLLDPTAKWPKICVAETLITKNDGRWNDDRIRMITDGKWKLLEVLSGNARLLFDRESDPNETKNLADANPEHTKRLLGYLQAFDLELEKLDSAEGRLAEATSLSEKLDTIRDQLNSPDLPTRLATYEGLIKEHNVEVLAALEDGFSQETPRVAYTLSVLIDFFLTADLSGAPKPTEYPAQPSPLRLRLIERLSRRPRYWNSELPQIEGALSAAESQAMDAARAVRGDQEARKRLATYGPTTRAHWRHITPILAASGWDAAHHLAHSLILYPATKEAESLRALKALAFGSPEQLKEVVTHLWPTPHRRVNQNVLKQLVASCLAAGEAVSVEALIALWPNAAPGEQQLIESAVSAREASLTPEKIKEIARAWSAARFAGHGSNGQSSYAALEQTLPQAVELPTIRRELAWARTKSPTDATELQVQVENLPQHPGDIQLGVPRFTLHSRAQEVAVGPGLVESLTCTWVQREADTPTKFTAALWFPKRMQITGERGCTQAIPCDYPTQTGTWELEIRWKGDLIPWAKKLSPHFVVAPKLKWDATQLAQATQSWLLPHRPLKNTVAFEALPDGPSGFRIPCELAAGSYEVSIELTAYPAQLSSPWAPKVFLESQGAASAQEYPQIALGESTILRVPLKVEESGSVFLCVNWPLQMALIEIQAMSLRKL